MGQTGDLPGRRGRLGVLQRVLPTPVTPGVPACCPCSLPACLPHTGLNWNRGGGYLSPRSVHPLSHPSGQTLLFYTTEPLPVLQHQPPAACECPGSPGSPSRSRPACLAFLVTSPVLAPLPRFHLLLTCSKENQLNVSSEKLQTMWENKMVAFQRRGEGALDEVFPGLSHKYNSAGFIAGRTQPRSGFHDYFQIHQ